MGPAPPSAALPSPPQGHGGFELRQERRPPRRNGTAPRYTNQSCRRELIAAAIRVAGERGYEAMRISEITDPVGVTRQAFYAHFHDKRHCMCEAIDPKLGVIERMAASLASSDPEAAAGIAHALDDLIAGRFGSPEGTRGRLVRAMIGLLRRDGSFHRVRIGALTRAAHVPPADFYRQFAGKRDCFSVAYQRLLDELIAEVCQALRARPSGGSGASSRPGSPHRQEGGGAAERAPLELATLLRCLADVLNSDHKRRRILLVEAAHLPDEGSAAIQGARKHALRDAIAALLADSVLGSEDGSEGERRVSFVAASIHEMIRSAELTGTSGRLPDWLADYAVRQARETTASQPPERVAA